MSAVENLVNAYVGFNEKGSSFRCMHVLEVSMKTTIRSQLQGRSLSGFNALCRDNNVSGVYIYVS